jgi:nucleoside-diphosphate-sugar epimerase
VLVTGGTGFVGSHVVEALAAAGHQARLLARDRSRVDCMAKTRGVAVQDVVLGDMTDSATVETALAGCDAVVHAAAAVEIGLGEAVFAANMAGTHNVLGGAARLGLDPIVNVSSVAIMFPPPGPRFTVDDPLVNLDTHYGRSKAEGERFARRLQSEGAPVVGVYPVGVYGPDDPGPGPSLKGLRDRIRYGWFMTTGGVGALDVRDLAGLIARTLEPGRGPRRYMAGGHFLPWADEADLCEAITGRKVRRLPAAPRVVEAIGHVVDFVKRMAPSFDYPLTHEASLFVTRFVPCDSSQTERELGVEFRPIEVTLEDSIRWLLDAGELAPKFAPRLRR